MRFKKFLPVFLIGIVILLSACGSSKKPSPKSSYKPPTPPPTVTQAPLPTEAPAANPDGVEVVLKLAEIHPDGFPTTLGDLKFAELVEERTGGKIKIDVYNNGQMGTEKDTVDMLQAGTLDFVRVGTNLVSGINSDMNALTLPYLYNNKEHLFKVLDGPIGDEFLLKLQDAGIIGLCWFDPGARNFYNSKKEIRTPADMTGLRIRVQDTKLMIDLVTLLGAVPSPMALNEVYGSIQNDIIDGAENNFPSYMSQAHNEVAPYITVDEHTIAPEFILVNKAVFEGLTESEQAIIKQAAVDAAIFQRQEWERQEGDYIKQAQSTGSTVTTLTNEELQLFRDAIAPIYNDYTQFAGIIEQIRATE